MRPRATHRRWVEVARRPSGGRGPAALGCLLLATLAAAPAAGTGAPEGESVKGPAGILRGTVEVGPELTARRIRLSLYPDVSGVAPAPAAFSAAEELRNVVISVDSPSLAALGPGVQGAPQRMEQRNETFQPHVLSVLKGSEVEFTNADPLFHNVFSLSKAAAFDLGRYPSGKSKSVRLERPGIVKVFCHIHPDMSAIILVQNNPFFAVPDAGGTFEIDGLPPGEHTVTAWHERAKPIRRTIRIEPGRATDVRFAIPLQDAPVGE